MTLLIALSLLLIGCPKQKTDMAEETAASEEVVQEPQTQEESMPEPIEEGPVFEVGTSWTSVPELGNVYFGYNKTALSPDSRQTLKKNAAVLKAVIQEHPSVKIRMEGHCDDRGTLDYNMALGQKRANAVRNYYASFGLPKANLTTISFGEEKPVCGGQYENCWVKNRRTKTTLKSPHGALRIPMP